MSEYDGVLRVASTVSERRGWVNARQVTEGMVTTLHEQDGALRQLGQVGGLGRQDNESIRAVRFIEDRGYVVTFRQTDPLYVLDLRDAAAPKVLGELKIPGYSGYLHPVGENLLLGVGQSGCPGTRLVAARPACSSRCSTSATPRPPPDRQADLRWRGCGGRVRPQGVPVLAAAQSDHRSDDLYGDDRRARDAFSGVVLLRATENGLTELGRLATADADGNVNRSLVIGDTVYLLSDQALQANSLDTHRQIDKLNF